MSEPPYEEIKKYISKNCPFLGMCFEELDERCRYEMMDGIPCRYMPELIMKFKEIYNE